MAKHYGFLRATLALLATVVSLLWLQPALAATGSQIDLEVDAALKTLYATSPTAKDVNTLTGKADVYAVIFDQKGLMLGISLQGTKVTKINR